MRLKKKDYISFHLFEDIKLCSAGSWAADNAIFRARIGIGNPLHYSTSLTTLPIHPSQASLWFLALPTTDRRHKIDSVQEEYEYHKEHILKLLEEQKARKIYLQNLKQKDHDKVEQELTFEGKKFFYSLQLIKIFYFFFCRRFWT